MSLTDRVPLTRARIIEAAVVLADDQGVEALSMRKIGAAVGVEAMSLYNHVANKDDLLDGVLDAILAEIELPSATDPWDDQLRAIAHEFRRVGHRHPRIFPLLGTRAIGSIEGFKPLERSYAALRTAGLGPADALDAFTSMASFVFGFVLTELGGLVDVAADRSAEFAHLDADDHPWLVELGVAYLQRDADRQFAFGLEQNLRGLGLGR